MTTPVQGRAWRTGAWLALALAIGAAAPLSGQHVSLGYHREKWSPSELRRFHGGLVRVAWDNGVELSFDMGASRWTDEGTLCAGLIFDPAACAPEPLKVASVTMAFAVGVSVVTLGVPGGELAVAPSAALALASLDRTGRMSGGGDHDDLTLLEVGLAARYSTRPLWRQWVGLFAEVRVAAGKDLRAGLCADCYNPLYGDAVRRSLLVGATVGR
jgi:hypothetical protein